MGFSKWEWLVLWNPRMRRKIVFVENRKLQAFITRNFIKLELNLGISFSILTWKRQTWVSNSLGTLCYWFSYLNTGNTITRNFWYFSFDFNSKQIYIWLRNCSSFFLQTYFLYVVFVGIVSFLYYGGPIFPTAYFTPKA